MSQGRTQPGQPGIRVLSGQSHAPGQRVAATARHTRVDERVEDPAFGLTQPGHHRNRECGEHLSHVRAGDTPRHLAPELVLGLPCDLDPAAPGLLAEPADPAFGGGRPLGVRSPGRLGGGQHPDDGDLLAVRQDLRRAGEPLTGQPAAEPAAHLLRGAAPDRSATSVRVIIRRGRVGRASGTFLLCIHVIMITACARRHKCPLPNDLARPDALSWSWVIFNGRCPRAGSGVFVESRSGRWRLSLKIARIAVYRPCVRMQMASATTSGWPAAWNSAWGFASMASRRLTSMIAWILCRHACRAAFPRRPGCCVRPAMACSALVWARIICSGECWRTA